MWNPSASPSDGAPNAKSIWHIDLDSFFVAAERLKNPGLRDRPVAVGGDGPRGVIASASYEARVFGVRSAMPTARALKLCPRLVLVHPTFGLYSSLSKQVFEIVARFTPTFEATGIDEGYLDMTGSETLFGPVAEAAATLKKTVLAETGLTISIGVASNRLVAKVATDFRKPDGLTIVPAGAEAAFLAPLPIEKLPGIGPKTAQFLRDRSVAKIGELQRYPVDVLEKRLGSFGRYLFDSGWGRGSCEFHAESKTRSISRETTFSEDVGDAGELENILWGMCAELGRELRESSELARVARLKLRYPPFQTVNRSRVLPRPTATDQALFEAVRELFREHWDSRAPLRLVGAGFVLAGEGERAVQLGLFEDARADARNERLDELKDRIRGKFGDKALTSGRDKPGD